MNLNDISELYKLSSIKSYKKGEIIARQGEHFNYSLGIIKGIVRTYTVKSNGEERTIRFTMEKDFTGCANCLLNNEKSLEFLEALEDCVVIQTNAKKFKELSQKNIRFLKLWDDNICEALNEAINRINFFLVLTPEERYDTLLKENPKLLMRVPQKYLASYIGVTTVSLSRIRNRKIQKKN